MPPRFLPLRASWPGPRLDDLMGLARRWMVERAGCTRGPADGHAVDYLGLAQAHENSRVVRRHQAVPAFLQTTDHAPSAWISTRASNRVALERVPTRVKADPVIPGRRVVAEDSGRAVLVADTRSRSPSSSRSPTARPWPRCRPSKYAPAPRLASRNRVPREIVVQERRLQVAHGLAAATRHCRRCRRWPRRNRASRRYRGRPGHSPSRSREGCRPPGRSWRSRRETSPCPRLR